MREREKFLYEYDFNDGWCHQIRVRGRLTKSGSRPRVEAIAPSDRPLAAAVCLAGKRGAPPEDCGGPKAFLAKRQHYSAGYGMEILADIRYNGPEVVGERIEEIRLLLRWLSLEKFDRTEVNRRLEQYATGDRDWLFVEEIGNGDPSSACFGQW